MASHANQSERPTLTPLWTGSQSRHSLPSTAFRTAQGPLLSPSPVSPGLLPSTVSRAPSEKLKPKDHASANGVLNKNGPLSASSPKSSVRIEGQSPLVSKLEEVSLHIADFIHNSSARSPLAARKHLGTSLKRRKLRPYDDYGNTGTADAFVIARSIRRDNSPTAETSHPFWEDDLQKSDLPRRLTLRAIVRPKASGRRTFLIQRSLDIDELRATAPPSILDQSHQDEPSPSTANRKPLPVPAKWSAHGRRQSTGQQSPQTERSSKLMSHPTDWDKLIDDPKTIPIHIHYAESALPALAVLLTSGHIHSGDILYLPVPHAESWPQTVRYVYTGEGELTPSMRQNIIYLGGRA